MKSEDEARHRLSMHFAMEGIRQAKTLMGYAIDFEMEAEAERDVAVLALIELGVTREKVGELLGLSVEHIDLIVGDFA